MEYSLLSYKSVVSSVYIERFRDTYGLYECTNTHTHNLYLSSMYL